MVLLLLENCAVRSCGGWWLGVWVVCGDNMPPHREVDENNGETLTDRCARERQEKAFCIMLVFFR
jgi:hypothetical protein